MQPIRWFVAGTVLLVMASLGVGKTSVWQDTASESPSAVDSIDPEKRLRELGIELPAPGTSLAIYKPVVISGNLAWLSGHIPRDPDGNIMTGKVGAEVSVEDAAAAARRCGIGLLATLKQEVGDLNRVSRLVKTTGMVNCTSDFTRQPEVINGCSQLLVDVFGEERGKGARAAVGMASLPRGAICEIEMVFELK